MDDIAVSIICNAYNHEKYIKDALESFIRQKVNFKYEILVHDDASTDNTAQIIKEYEHKYPNLINAIYQIENQYSKGQGIVSEIQSQRARGKYIALCEGDDYWIDDQKLQKQYDALEKKPNVDICATAAICVKSDTKKVLSYITPKTSDTIIAPEEVIKGGGEYVATNSLMYRSKLDYNKPRFRKILKLDYTLQIHGALRGGMLYLSDTTAAYRYMSKGSWTSRIFKNKEATIALLNRKNKMLEQLNLDTDGEFSEIIKTTIKKNQFNLLSCQGNLNEMKSEKYSSLYDQLSWIEKIKLYIKSYCPWVINLRDMLKKD